MIIPAPAAVAFIKSLRVIDIPINFLNNIYNPLSDVYAVIQSPGLRILVRGAARGEACLPRKALRTAGRNPYI